MAKASDRMRMNPFSLHGVGVPPRRIESLIQSRVVMAPGANSYHLPAIIFENDESEYYTVGTLCDIQLHLDKWHELHMYDATRVDLSDMDLCIPCRSAKQDLIKKYRKRWTAEFSDCVITVSRP